MSQLGWGLLWFDDDNGYAAAEDKGLVARVCRAATRYEQKAGHPPDVCHCRLNGTGKHPETVAVRPGVDVQLVDNPTVLPSHYWVGRATE